MFNTVLFGTGAGLVIYAWILQIQAAQLSDIYSPEIWTNSERLFIATITILLAGFFHSLTVLYPAIKSTEIETKLANARASRLENLAMYDGLTEIHNRRFFDEALVAYLEEFKKTRAQFGLLLVDIDFFKSINDEHGHDAGDTVLKEIAKCISGLAREHDIVARIGGEEFAIIAPFANKGDLESIGQRYRNAIEKLTLKVDNAKLRVTVSIGASSNKDASTAAEMFKAADRNLYEAKRGGRNRVMVEARKTPVVPNSAPIPCPDTGS